MNIGFIGCGNMGSTIARLLASAGHQVAVSNSRGPQSLSAFAGDNNVKAVTVEEVVLNKNLVVIALPQGQVTNISPALFKQCAADTIFMDIGNYYPGIRDAEITEIERGMPESEWVSQVLSVPVIKAFNSITSWSLGNYSRPAGTAGRICLPVAGDSGSGKKTVIALMDQLGFDGIDAGPLANSWKQQPGSPAYCTDLDREQLISALDKAEYNKIAAYRSSAMDAARRMVEQAGSLAEAVANAGKK